MGPNPEGPSPCISSSGGAAGEPRRGGLRAFLNAARECLSLMLFAFAIMFASFAYGAAMVRYQIFPYWIMSGAVKTLSAALSDPETIRDIGEFIEFSAAPPRSAAADRIEFAACESLGGPVLWYGGRWQFLDLCPEWGCVAVEYSPVGKVVHAYPYRPDELQRAAEASSAAAEHPYEFAPGFSFQRDLGVRGVSMYENGDLLVTLHYEEKAFPYGAGVARINRDGHPVWFRSDYSHHWNYLDAGGAWGVAPGDIVASLRNLSAFAVIDPETGALKRLVRGTFVDQHSVYHLEGSAFIMFDNHGSDSVHGPPRLLAIDIADGSETTIFPNDWTPEAFRSLYSRSAADVSVSPDRRRAIVAFTPTGLALEVRLSDGEVLSVFRNLHDVSGLGQFPEGREDSAAKFKLYGVDYIR